jgi:hypothetical protein
MDAHNAPLDVVAADSIKTPAGGIKGARLVRPVITIR